MQVFLMVFGFLEMIFGTLVFFINLETPGHGHMLLPAVVLMVGGSFLLYFLVREK